MLERHHNTFCTNGPFYFAIEPVIGLFKDVPLFTFHLFTIVVMAAPLIGSISRNDWYKKMRIVLATSVDCMLALVYG